MELSDILTTDMVSLGLTARSKKQVLADMATKLSNKAHLDNNTTFEHILEREHLGSTGIGNGIAIPHARIPELKHITGAFATLKHPIGFDAIDNKPVRSIFMLLAPIESGADHLKSLSILSRIFRDKDFCMSLSLYKDPKTLYQDLIKQQHKS